MDTVFLVTGGGAMHLNDSFGKSDRMRKIFCHHEQGCAIAAEGYSRTSGKLGLVNVTSGPGGLNTLTGVMGQWTDSVPVLYISGQVRYDTTVESQKGRLELRQLGDQEVDIISVVKPLTKFAMTVKEPSDIRWILENAIHEAISGRPGPVWVNVPHNVQSALVDEERLIGYEPGPTVPSDKLEDQASRLMNMLSEAKRPIVVCGRGTRISGTIEMVKEFCQELRYKGRFGVYEMFVIDDEVRQAVIAGGSVNQLKTLFRKQRRVMERRSHGDHVFDFFRDGCERRGG